MTSYTPITIRHDGWTAARKTQFLDHLANDGSVRAACGRVGMSREAAYRLKRRDPLFSRAWNAALMLAREVGAEELASRALDGVEEDVWYKGELVGTRRKYDSRLLLAHMARLDRIAEDPRAGEDAARFDELLAVVGGQEVPADLAGEDDVLPFARDEVIEIASRLAEDDWDQMPEERIDASLQEACARAEAESAAEWDAWHGEACGSVDRLLDAPAAPAAAIAADTLSELSTSPAGPAEPASGPDSVAVVAEASTSPDAVQAKPPLMHPTTQEEYDRQIAARPYLAPYLRKPGPAARS